MDKVVNVDSNKSSDDDHDSIDQIGIPDSDKKLLNILKMCDKFDRVRRKALKDYQLNNM